MAAPQHASWEQEWDADVVAKLGDTASQDGLDVLNSVEEWGEWGELPGQPQASPSPPGDTLEEIADRVMRNSDDWVEGVGAPGVSDSPPSTSHKVLTTWQSRPPSQAQQSASRVLTGKEEELRDFLASWHQRFAVLEEFMTSNETALMSVVKKRTEEWIQKNGIHVPEECDSKKEYLNRILNAVEIRKQEWDHRPAAAEELSGTAAAALELCNETLSSSQKPGLSPHQLTAVQMMKEEAEKTARWLRTEVAAQLNKAKHADPIVFTDDLVAARLKLLEACTTAYGSDKLDQSKRAVGSCSTAIRVDTQAAGLGTDDETEQLIPAGGVRSQHHNRSTSGQLQAETDYSRPLQKGWLSCCFPSYQ
mmetsp:Transcript_28309/g.79910  ORF Transcript_28309/g.79910 Transcript_28309/m.79910 type:complete len:363 (+) Transcript_28309:244-1332(+)|eukprot:CAMPEP_0117654376 /NCGR_PEP_ID=MMETSP0804-20121206/3710_1 /TAXON_ID=1074897 /ORGANISM="Tetraselmis astigmatica, Strain CCMP880" /LENGTH=362 /DNA_ID=CAMNT_0005460651 /DNA_START=222 /DNA_END=1310 /DNA_ORIENTATION=-